MNGNNAASGNGGMGGRLDYTLPPKYSLILEDQKKKKKNRHVSKDSNGNISVLRDSEKDSLPSRS
jgi:hypothetical protein